MPVYWILPLFWGFWKYSFDIFSMAQKNWPVVILCCNLQNNTSQGTNNYINAIVPWLEIFIGSYGFICIKHSNDCYTLRLENNKVIPLDTNSLSKSIILIVQVYITTLILRQWIDKGRVVGGIFCLYPCNDPYENPIVLYNSIL